MKQSWKLVTTLSKTFRANPEKLLEINFLEKMWFKELVLTYSPLIAFGFIYDIFFKNPLPPELKEDLEQVFQDIPENMGTLISANLANNVDKAPELAKTISEGFKNSNMANAPDPLVKLYETKKAFKQNNIEFKEDNSIVKLEVIENVNRESDSLKTAGWTLYDPNVTIPPGQKINMTKSIDKKYWYKLEN